MKWAGAVWLSVRISWVKGPFYFPFVSSVSLIWLLELRHSPRILTRKHQMPSGWSWGQFPPKLTDCKLGNYFSIPLGSLIGTILICPGRVDRVFWDIGSLKNCANSNSGPKIWARAYSFVEIVLAVGTGRLVSSERIISSLAQHEGSWILEHGCTLMCLKDRICASLWSSSSSLAGYRMPKGQREKVDIKKSKPNKKPFMSQNQR